MNGIIRFFFFFIQMESVHTFLTLFNIYSDDDMGIKCN